MRLRLSRWTRTAAASIAVALFACSLACATAESTRTEPSPAASNANWDAFAGANKTSNTINSRVVPVTPIEITGVAYVRGVKLAWSASDRVPTYEAANQTLKLPAETRQAVLQIAIVDLPTGADVRVDWYHESELVFSDALAEHEDGDHFFALVKRNGKQLEKLPAGEYRAVVHDGTIEIKTVHFQIEA